MLMTDITLKAITDSGRYKHTSLFGRIVGSVIFTLIGLGLLFFGIFIIPNIPHSNFEFEITMGPYLGVIFGFASIYTALYILLMRHWETTTFNWENKTITIRYRKLGSQSYSVDYSDKDITAIEWDNNDITIRFKEDWVLLGSKVDWNSTRTSEGFATLIANRYDFPVERIRYYHESN